MTITAVQPAETQTGTKTPDYGASALLDIVRDGQLKAGGIKAHTRIETGNYWIRVLSAHPDKGTALFEEGEVKDTETVHRVWFPTASLIAILNDAKRNNAAIIEIDSEGVSYTTSRGNTQTLRGSQETPNDLRWVITQPLFADWDAEYPLSINATELAYVTSKLSTDTSRPMLTAACARTNGSIVGTDSFRLAQVNDAVLQPPERSVLIPLSVMQRSTAIANRYERLGWSSEHMFAGVEMAKSLAVSEDRMQTAILYNIAGDNPMRWTIYDRSVPGDYPTVEGLIPDLTGKFLRIQVQNWIIKAAKQLSGKDRQIKMYLKINDDSKANFTGYKNAKIIMRSTDTNSSEFTTTSEIVGTCTARDDRDKPVCHSGQAERDGAKFVVGLTSSYFVDTLKGASDHSVEILLKDDLKPFLVIDPINDAAKPRKVGLQMPVRM